MTGEQVARAMQDVQFLEDLPPQLIQPLADVAKVIDFSAGDVIFRQGDLAKTIYLIVSGSVSLEMCATGIGCRQILTVSTGDLLGWSPVLEQQRLAATARVLAPAETIQLDGPQVLAICEQDPRVGYAFMKRAALALAKRLNATRLQLLDMYGSEMPAAPGFDPPQQRAEGSTA